MSATRRLWANRMSRAGWLLAPVFEAPVFVWRWLRWPFKTGQNFITTLLATLLMSIPGVCVFGISMSIYDSRNATPLHIKEAFQNSCVAELVPRRQAHTGGALSVGDLRKAKNDCDEAIEKWRIVAEQKAAMGVK